MLLLVRVRVWVGGAAAGRDSGGGAAGGGAVGSLTFPPRDGGPAGTVNPRGPESNDPRRAPQAPRTRSYSASVASSKQTKRTSSTRVSASRTVATATSVASASG